MSMKQFSFIYDKTKAYADGYESTSSMVGCGFFSTIIGLPTTTCIGRLKGTGDLQEMTMSITPIGVNV